MIAAQGCNDWRGQSQTGLGRGMSSSGRRRGEEERDRDRKREKDKHKDKFRDRDRSRERGRHDKVGAWPDCCRVYRSAAQGPACLRAAVHKQVNRYIAGVVSACKMLVPALFTCVVATTQQLRSAVAFSLGTVLTSCDFVFQHTCRSPSVRPVIGMLTSRRGMSANARQGAAAGAPESWWPFAAACALCAKKSTVTASAVTMLVALHT